VSTIFNIYPAKPQKLYFYGTYLIDVIAPWLGIDAITFN